MIHVTNFQDKPKKEGPELDQWHEINDEPEYDWVSFQQSQPIFTGKSFRVYIKGKDGIVSSYRWTARGMVHSGYTHWCYMVIHDQKVKHWNERRFKYEGWRDMKSTGKQQVFVKGTARVIIFSDDVISIDYNQFRYCGPNNAQLFEQICKQFGIEL